MLPKDLVEAVRKHHVIPFVGAGVSRGVKRGLFPGWDELLQALAGELEAQGLPDEAAQLLKDVATGDYLEAAELALQQLGAFRFNRFLRARFRLKRPEDANLAVVQAVWALRPPLVLTTNYDDVLAWGLEHAERLANDQVDELALMHAEESPDTPRIWHLHGTIHRLSTVILGGSDYERLYGPEPEGKTPQDEQRSRQQAAYRGYASAVAELEKRLASRPFLYVGFSFNDSYVLRQVKHVLQAMKGKNAPSYALMKKGEGNKAHLWSNYNIQLIEYEEHGPPLVALLDEMRRAAFGEDSPKISGPLSFSMPAPLAAPAASVAGIARAAEIESAPAREAATLRELPHVPRPKLVEEYARILEREQKLVLLAPRRGGARSLARQVARRYGERVTWLAPPNHPDVTEAEYCRVLADDYDVTDFEGLLAYLRREAAGLGGPHLVVLRYEWGPFQHLKTLGNYLRKLLEEPSEVPFHVLVAGGIRSAWLIHHVEKFSAFKDAPRREVPDFTVDEVRQFLNGAGYDGARWAPEVCSATGGHLGLLNEALLGGGALDETSLTERLARSPVLRDMVRDRLREDDRDRRSKERHARWVLGELLAGREVQRLDVLDQQTDYAEVRLYFDGLVKRNATGRTVLRCRSAEKVAQEALARQEGMP